MREPRRRRRRIEPEREPRDQVLRDEGPDRTEIGSIADLDETPRPVRTHFAALDVGFEVHQARSALAQEHLEGHARGVAPDERLEEQRERDVRDAIRRGQLDLLDRQCVALRPAAGRDARTVVDAESAAQRAVGAEGPGFLKHGL